MEDTGQLKETEQLKDITNYDPKKVNNKVLTDDYNDDWRSTTSYGKSSNRYGKLVD